MSNSMGKTPESGDEYDKAMREFFQKYFLLKKKYNLRADFHCGQGHGEKCRIEIWEYTGIREKKCVCRFKEEEMETCWRKAAVMLDIFKWREEEEQEMKTG